MNRHGPPQKGTPIMNRVPGPRTPQSNVESGVEDDQEWLQHWSVGAWGGREPKKKMVIFGGVPFYEGGCRILSLLDHIEVVCLVFS